MEENKIRNKIEDEEEESLDFPDAEEEEEDEEEENIDENGVDEQKNNDNNINLINNYNNNIDICIDGGNEQSKKIKDGDFGLNDQWMIYDKDGNLIKHANSLGLFEYLTRKVLGNHLLLNNYIIINENNQNEWKGGTIYLDLLKKFPLSSNTQKGNLLEIINNSNYNNM